jgi:LysR family hydrogen peroxide-inducible transcriptional activator
VAVADAGHIGSAAAACAVSQPALSEALKKLEERLNVTLFERTNRHVRPTHQGAELVDQARRVLEEARRFEDIAQNADGTLSGPLVLGVIPTLAPYLLPIALADLTGAFPNLQLIIKEAQTDALVDGLAAHHYDAILLALPTHLSSTIETVTLFDEPFAWVCRDDDPMAGRSVVTPGDIVDRKLLLLDEGHCLRSHALQVCQSPYARQPDGADFSASSIEMLRELVGMGFGTTLLPALAVRAGRGLQPPLTAVGMEGGSVFRRVSMAWRPQHPWAAHMPQVARIFSGAAEAYL